MAEIKTTRITVMRAEGPSELCGKEYEFTGDDVWEQALAHLRVASMSAPGSAARLPLGYDKTDFTITWADGETYSGTLGMTYHEYSIGNHVRGYLEHLIEKHDDYLRAGAEIPEVDALRNFLTTYEIGDL